MKFAWHVSEQAAENLLQHEGQYEDAEHQERDADLRNRTKHDANPGGNTYSGGCAAMSAVRQLANHRTDKWPEYDTENAEEQACDRSQRRTNQRQATGADTFRSQHTGKQVDEHREHHQAAEYGKHDWSEVGEAIAPGHKQHAHEYDWHPWQRW